MPALWAVTNENLSLCYQAMAERGDEPRENLIAAEQSLLNALRVYSPEHMSYDYGTATASLSRIRKNLAALSA